MGEWADWGALTFRQYEPATQSRERGCRSFLHALKRYRAV